MKRGRRQGKPDTRAAVLDAARQCFATYGFGAATTRMIASEAGVDPAMINHYFGGKNKLFLATIDIDIDPRQVAARLASAEPDELGVRFAGVVIGTWESPAKASLIAALRAAISDPSLATMIRDFLFAQIVSRVLREAACPAEESELRGSLIVSQMLGVLVGRYVLELDPLASLPAEAVIANIGRTLQRYLTGPLAECLR